MPSRGWLARFVERWLTPWHDEREAQAVRERSEAIRQRSIQARIRSEKVREAYSAAGDRTRRR